MAGIMGASILKGLGDGITSLGSSAMQYAGQNERQRLQEQMLRERLESNERNVDARLAAKTASGTGAAKGTIDFAEDTAGEEAMAADMGITVPELRRLRAANRTGDFSAYEVDDVNAPGDGIGPSDGKRGMTAATRKYVSEKRKMLGEISRMYMQGDAYDDSSKGRKTVQDMGIMDDVLDGRRDAKTVAKAQAAADGKLPYSNLGSDGVFDQYEGGQKLNELGVAKAGNERAGAAKAAAGAKDDSLQAIQQLRIAAEGTLKDARRALTEFDKLNPVDVSKPGKERLKAQRDELVADIASARSSLDAVSKRLDQRLADKSGKGADQPPPSPGAAPAPQNPKPKAITSLPPGAKQIGTSGGKPVYQTPDGKRFIPS